MIAKFQEMRWTDFGLKCNSGKIFADFSFHDNFLAFQVISQAWHIEICAYDVLDNWGISRNFINRIRFIDHSANLAKDISRDRKTQSGNSDVNYGDRGCFYVNKIVNFSSTSTKSARMTARIKAVMRGVRNVVRKFKRGRIARAKNNTMIWEKFKFNVNTQAKIFANLMLFTSNLANI